MTEIGQSSSFWSNDSERGIPCQYMTFRISHGSSFHSKYCSITKKTPPLVKGQEDFFPLKTFCENACTAILAGAHILGDAHILVADMLMGKHILAALPAYINLT